MQPSLNPDRPKVPLPAPIYMAFFVMGGVLLNKIWPMAIHYGAIQVAVGWGLILLASALLLWCFQLFLLNRTTIMPRNPVNSLVIKGPYRFSRNPMYLSLVLIHLGIGIATGNLWQAPTLALSVLAIRRCVIAPEEQYMNTRFADAYQDYCLKVPRWFWRNRT